MQLLLKVQDIKVSAKWQAQAVTFNPLEDIVYQVSVPDDLILKENGQAHFEIAGIKHILKELHRAINLEEQF